MPYTQRIGSWYHLFFTVCGFFFLALFLFLAIRLTKDKIILVLRIMGVVFILAEIYKILTQHFLYGEIMDGLWPVYYCSLYLYIVPFLFFKKSSKVFNFGLKVMMYYGLVPALTYICYPVTAINYHPIASFSFWHSMLYHVNMLFSSLIIMIKGFFPSSFSKDLLPYSIFTIGFCLIIFAINKITDMNFMFSNRPGNGNTALELLQKIVTPYLYPVAVIAGQCLGSYLVSFGVLKLIEEIKRKKAVV